MMDSTALYSIPDEAQPHLVSTYEPLPQYRDWQFDNRTITDLLDELTYLIEYLEELKTLRLELFHSKPTVSVIEVRIRDLLEVMERRKRLLRQHEGDPLAPVWRAGTGKIGKLAVDLKKMWPLPRFCREMLLLDLHGRGDQLRARCPIPSHDDKTPSFVVTVSEDRWRCFGACDCGGDIYDLIRAMYGYESFTAQVKLLAQASGMDATR